MTRVIIVAFLLTACAPGSPGTSSSLPVETASPAPSEGLDPVSAAAVDHMLSALDELQDLSHRITAASNASDNEAVYIAFANLERYATEEHGWAEGQPEFENPDVDEVVTIYSLKMISLELLAFRVQEEFFTGNTEAARDAGEAVRDLLSMRGRLLVLQPD